MKRLKLPEINDPLEWIKENKKLLYPLILYAAGLVFGSFLYARSSLAQELLAKLLEQRETVFLHLFINRLGLYTAVFTLTVLFGLCLIGYPFINAVPLICGTEIAMKISYYYVHYSVKGAGYALLLVLPQAAAFITVLLYTVKTSNQVTSHLFHCARKNADTEEQTTLKWYLRTYLIYYIFMVLIVLINAMLVCAFTPIIHL